MNEMELLTRLRDEVPADVVPARAESALLTAIQAGEAPATAAPGSLRARGLAALGRAERGPAAWGAGSPGRRGSRRAWRLALAGGVSLALAAGVFAAQAIQSGGSGPGISVQVLAYRTAAAAAAQPAVRPGQWVYWQEKAADGKPDGIFQVWTTADSRKAAYAYNGEVRSVSWWCGKHGTSSAGGCGQFIGQPAVFVLPHGQGVTVSALTGKLPLRYADLGSLPSSPLALDRYLGRLHLPGWGSAPVREFEVIKELLATYVMPPGLTAELYRALGDIPGVTVDHHAVDVAGRNGIGFRITLPPLAGGAIDEIVINPRTYHLMGQQLITSQPAGSAGRVLGGTAILRQALVSGPGVRP